MLKDDFDSGLKVINTDNDSVLTVDDVRELKKLASLSRATRLVFGIIFGVVGLFGINAVMDYLHTHLR